MSDLSNVPMTGQGSFQLLGGLADIRRVSTSAVVSHYNVRPVIDIHAATHGRDWLTRTMRRMRRRDIEHVDESLS